MEGSSDTNRASSLDWSSDSFSSIKSSPSRFASLITNVPLSETPPHILPSIGFIFDDLDFDDLDDLFRTSPASADVVHIEESCLPEAEKMDGLRLDAPAPVVWTPRLSA